MSLTAGGTVGLRMMSCSYARSVSCDHAHVSVKALIWAGELCPVCSLKSTL